MAIASSRMLIPPLLPNIEAEFDIPHAQAALLMSSYLLPYAMIQIPAGILSDKFGNKRFIILAMIGASAGSSLIIFTSTFNQALAVRLFSGTLSGLYYAASTKVITKYASSLRQGRVLGLAFSGSSVANLLIYVAVASSKSEIGWRYFFVISSLPGFLCLALSFFIKEMKEKNMLEDVNRHNFMKYLKNRFLIFALTSYLLMSLANWGLTAFIPTYLVKERGLTVADSSAAMIIYAASSIFNSFSSGYVTDRFGFKISMVASGITMCLVSFFLPLLPLGGFYWLLLILWGLIGGWSFTALNIFVINTFPKNLHGTFLGTLNQIGFISATIGPPLFGLMIDVTGFESFFSLALVLYVASFFITLLIKGQIRSF